MPLKRRNAVRGRTKKRAAPARLQLQEDMKSQFTESDVDSDYSRRSRSHSYSSRSSRSSCSSRSSSRSTSAGRTQRQGSSDDDEDADTASTISALSAAAAGLGLVATVPKPKLRAAVSGSSILFSVAGLMVLFTLGYVAVKLWRDLQKVQVALDKVRTEVEGSSLSEVDVAALVQHEVKQLQEEKQLQQEKQLQEEKQMQDSAAGAINNEEKSVDPTLHQRIAPTMQQQQHQQHQQMEPMAAAPQFMPQQQSMLYHSMHAPLPVQHHQQQQEWEYRVPHFHFARGEFTPPVLQRQTNFTLIDNRDQFDASSEHSTSECAVCDVDDVASVPDVHEDDIKQLATVASVSFSV